MVEEGLTPEARAALARLGSAHHAPADLEDRVVNAVRAEGLIGSRSPNSTPTWRAVGLLAAATAIFVAGIATQRLLAPLPGVDSGGAGAPTSSRYLLMLLEPRDQPLPEAEEARRVEEYSRWARGLAAAGVLEAGEKLAAAGHTVAGSGTGAPPAGPEVVSGFFIVKASTDAEARRIAESCPHVTHGGRVEVRRIEPT